MNPQTTSPDSSVTTDKNVPKAELPSVPDTWPGGFGVYKYSKQAIRLNLGSLFILWISSFVIGILLSSVAKNVGAVVANIVTVYLTAAWTMVYLAGVKKRKLSVQDSLKQSGPLFLKFIGLTILTTLTIILSFLLLIIPFFFVAPRVVLAQYYLLDKNMGIIEAYKASWYSTKGHVGKVYGIMGAGAAMALLFITIIGIPFAIYFLVMYQAAIAVLYGYILEHPKHDEATQSSPVSPAPATV